MNLNLDLKVYFTKEARRGQARPQARPGEARRGQARPGEARRGQARPGEARRGQARPGSEDMQGHVRPCKQGEL